MNLAVVIATRNRAEHVRRLVKELSGWNCEAIVVDDYSQRPLAVEGARIIRNSRRLGGGESWNVGCRHANSDWLLLIADDLVPGPGLASFIDKLLPRLETRDVVGFRIVGFNRIGSRRVKLPYRNTTFSRMLNILFGVDVSLRTGPSRFTTGAMMFHSEFFASLGGFDSRTFAGNGFREESDLQWRARRMGGRLTYVEDPSFQHLDATGGYQKRYSENEFYYMRNQTIFAFRTARLSSLAMIAGFGAYLLANGLRISTILRGISQGAKIGASRPVSSTTRTTGFGEGGEPRTLDRKKR